ncbi:hypothetical protein [Flavicella sp.]|uniref:hypothetical protein n=1 Tax=Flavicella sp. TaxID=2957742 RepID=UPI00301A46CF
MKKLIRISLLLCVFTFGASSTVSAQESYGGALNLFAKIGDDSAISGYYEFALAKNFTISPEATIPLNFDYIHAGARVDYYFDSLLNLNEPWDIWGGAGAGLYMGTHDDGGIILDLHIGGEYKFNQTWGIILEAGGRDGGTGSLGVGIHL